MVSEEQVIVEDGIAKKALWKKRFYLIAIILSALWVLFNVLLLFGGLDVIYGLLVFNGLLGFLIGGILLIVALV